MFSTARLLTIEEKGNGSLLKTLINLLCQECIVESLKRSTYAEMCFKTVPGDINYGTHFHLSLRWESSPTYLQLRQVLGVEDLLLG